MNIVHYVKFTCWSSIVLLLWGMITKLIESSFIAWFAFCFFLMVAILLALVSWNK